MDKVKINYVSHATHHLASHRMRVMKHVELLNVCSDKIEATVDKVAIPNAHVNVFQKHFDQRRNLDMLQSGKQLGYKTVMDVCDDHFDREHGQYYKKMCEHADLITCNTKPMAERIKEVTGREAHVIPDPIMFPFYPPEIIGGYPTLAWYGHGSNLPPLKKWLDQMERKVTVFTNTNFSHPLVDLIQWRPNLVESKIHRFNLALVPVSDDPWVKFKSPNRVVDAINAGCFVITDGEDLYKEFKDFVFLVKDGSEVEDVITYCQENQEHATFKVRKGQEYVLDNYSDSTLLNNILEGMKKLEIIKEYS